MELSAKMKNVPGPHIPSWKGFSVL